MKKRLHDKKAGIAILLSLIIISAFEVVFRFVSFKDVMFITSNLGVPFATFIFATFLLIFTFMGKDRICFICYGVWISCFIMDQIIGLPGVVTSFIRTASDSAEKVTLAHINGVARILSMLSIIGIGALLIEYMNDGTIYNKAFNVLCAITIVLLFISIGIGVYATFTVDKLLVLDVFNNVFRLTMVILATFFAYDSAKMQLKKKDLTK